MRLSRMLLIAMVLVLVSIVAADAATLRTAAFAGIDMSSGFARCAVTNAGTWPGVVSAFLYDHNGNFMAGFSSQTIRPHSTLFTPFSDLATETPTHCECVVPSVVTFRCSLVYFNENITTSVSAP